MPTGICSRLPAQERFWTKVKKGSTDDCWEWMAALDTRGYGAFWEGSRQVHAHRFAYELMKGPILNGLTIDHLCRNRTCVNPEHMEPVTNRENILRGMSFTAINARKTHCVHGHALSGSNLHVMPGIGRWCKACKRIATAHWKSSNRGRSAPKKE